MITLSTQEGVEAAQAVLRDQFQPAQVATQNVAAALDLEAPSVLTYRGRQYRVPPVPWHAGLQLQQYFVTLQRLIGQEETVAQLNELVTLMEQLLPLFKQLVTPVSWLERLQWRWTNPFNAATQQELGELLGFFFACRMKSSVRFADHHAAQPLLSSTVPKTSRFSSGNSRPGVSTVNHGVGGTTS